MKKTCNKLKKDWNETVPKVKSVFRKSPSMEKKSKRCSGFYDFQEAQSNFEKGISQNSVYLDNDVSSPSSETDVEELYAHPKNIDRNNSRFEYDVPRISFKFFEKRFVEEEDQNQPEDKPVLVKHVKKSEFHIVLEQPAENQPNSDNTDIDNHLEFSFQNSEYDALKTLSRKTGSQSDIVEYRSQQPKIPATVMKSGSDPNLTFTLNDNDDDDDDDGLYKVPRCLKVQHRLSRSLTDFDPENTNLDISKSPQSSIEHVSCSQVNIARQKLALDLQQQNCGSTSSVRSRRTALFGNPKKVVHSWNNFKAKISHVMHEQAAQQKVGAFSDKDKILINVEGLYKTSKSKCKKMLQNTGKLFTPKRSGSTKDEEESNTEKSPGSTISNQDKQTKSERIKLKASDIEYKFETDDVEDADQNSDNCSPMNTFKSEYSDVGSKDEFDLNTIKNTFKKKLIRTPEGHHGFEDLRRYVKQGSDFCKELAAILYERAEAETHYAKSLSKLSTKLSRACKDGVGEVNEAWKAVAIELEAKAEAHRIVGNALLEETAKPLRTLTENQHRTRKQCETSVEKAARVLADWRAAEAKGKKQSHSCARDNEKLQDAAIMDTTKLGKQTLSKSSSLIQLANRQNSIEKENAKLECKRKKAEDAVKKADIEYYTLCVRAERARLEWESSVLRGVNTFQQLEEERLNNLKLVLSSYLRHVTELQPRIMEATERLKLPISSADPCRDLGTFQNLRQTSQKISEQLLPDFYCEHITLAMNRERRKQALIKLLHLIRLDIERERKSKNGLENLSKAIKQTPNFGSDDSQQTVVEKLYHMKSMLTYLEGARYKVQSALAELDSRPRTGHPLAPHITITRDKSGLQQSVLKVPHWLQEEFMIDADRSPLSEKSIESARSDININEADDLDDWAQRGDADGNSNQPDSDFDEFSSQSSNPDQPSDPANVQHIARCTAIYAYTPNLPDELVLNPGDILKVYRQQDDGWWLGECNGNVGIFPATYVKIMPT